jgi:hypothetical protein
LPNSPTPHMSQQGNRVTDEAVPRNRLITVEIFGATDSRRLIGLIWSVPTASQAYAISAWSLKNNILMMKICEVGDGIIIYDENT